MSMNFVVDNYNYKLLTKIFTNCNLLTNFKDKFDINEIYVDKLNYKIYQKNSMIN